MRLNFAYLFIIAFLDVCELTIFLGIKYDAAEKEEKSLQDIKQRELSRIEEALQKAAEKGNNMFYVFLEKCMHLCFSTFNTL